MNNIHGPTELLKEEHQAVLKKLDALQEIVNHLDQKEANKARFEELMSFFQTDFWVHFDKEEKALFTEFDNFMPRGSGPIAVMIDEHEVLRNTNEAMQQDVAKYLNHSDNAETRQAIVDNGTHFIEFLRNHIFKEDNILFSMADMHFDRGQNEKVVKLFEQIEKSERKGG
ncbi:MAG: hemerythrin domain-containing protein [Chloroflexi bacterium]|nr:hemerythrin domain-containing protein [Chloroflexota bacterium]